jgi:hypothetical protein
MAVPVMFIMPLVVLEFLAPSAFVAPPRTFPMIFNVPLPETATPGLWLNKPPVIPPEHVTVVVPAPEVKTPAHGMLPPPELPPLIVVALIVRVPDPLLFIVDALDVPKHFISLETMFAIAGEFAEKVTHTLLGLL